MLDNRAECVVTDGNVKQFVLDMRFTDRAAPNLDIS
ncbi:Hypotetical protein [Gulosibacter molinativorax]|nr:Hypotetical protein [Gulosibacter molinativorax]